MDLKKIRDALVAALRRIQELCGYDGQVVITGETKPLSDLEGFDSTLVPPLIDMLCDELGISIARDVNICADGRRKLSLDEIVPVVMKAAKKENGHVAKANDVTGFPGAADARRSTPHP